MPARIEGMTELRAKLDRMSRIGTAISGDMDALAEGVQVEAKLRCPVHTGALRASIDRRTDVEDQRVESSVYSDKSYAAAVEQGTYATPARPFLYPALKDNEQPITDAIAESARRAILAAVGRVL